MSRKRNKFHLCKAVPLTLNIYSRKNFSSLGKKNIIALWQCRGKELEFLCQDLVPSEDFFMLLLINLFLGAEPITRGSFSFNSPLSSWKFSLCACKDIVNLPP